MLSVMMMMMMESVMTKDGGCSVIVVSGGDIDDSGSDVMAMITFIPLPFAFHL